MSLNAQLHNDLEGLPLFNSNQLLKNWLGNETRNTYVPVDILESEKSYTVVLALPGIKEDQVDIELDRDELLVSVEPNPTTIEGVKFLRKEIQTEKVKKSFKIPEHIDRDKVEANLENGLLTIQLFKGEKFQPRKINVKAS